MVEYSRQNIEDKNKTDIKLKTLQVTIESTLEEVQLYQLNRK